MAKRIGTARRKTRDKLRKNVRRKGKISLGRYFQVFDSNDKVRLIAEPSYHKGMYFPRFHNKMGTVKRKNGTCYEIMIKDGRKDKMLIIHPVHLRKVK